VSSERVPNDCPALAVDPFAAEFLADPHPYHERLREAGAVVWLERYGIYGMARHEQVAAALEDWRTYSSASGVGLDDFRKSKPWRPPSILLEVDPPLHTRTRGVMSKILSSTALQALREDWQGKADALIEQLVARGTFDAVADLGAVFPLQVFPSAVGVMAQGRQNLLPFANMVFNSFGPRNEIFLESIRAAEPVVGWIMAASLRENLTATGFGAQVYAAADRGELSPDEAAILVRSMLTAGLDTTVIGIASAVHAFAEHPQQWHALRADPALIRRAFDEVVRWASPVQTFFRTTTEPVAVAGVHIPEGAKVLLFLGAANRDPRRWESPEVLDLQRRTLGHVGFGFGVHSCVGQMVAKLEAEVLLRALSRRVARIELVGAPLRHLNNTLRAFAALPVRVQVH
jgi:4-methoxybenzoate monooxygenase (O-demethylating)